MFSCFPCKDKNEGQDRVGSGINLLLKDEPETVHDSVDKFEFPSSIMNPKVLVLACLC